MLGSVDALNPESSVVPGSNARAQANEYMERYASGDDSVFSVIRCGLKTCCSKPCCKSICIAAASGRAPMSPRGRMPSPAAY